MIEIDTGTQMIGMKADVVTGGVLLGVTALILLLRGIVLRGDTRDTRDPRLHGTRILTEPAITHTHPEADPVVTPLVTLAMTHVADLSRLVDTFRTLADRGALEVIPVAAADLQVCTSLEITTRLSTLLQDLASIMDHILRLSFFHHPHMHLQDLIDHQLCYLLVVAEALQDLIDHRLCYLLVVAVALQDLIGHQLCYLLVVAVALLAALLP